MLGFVFVAAFVSIVYFGLSISRVARSPEVKADMERLREQRRRRKAAKRS
jgi:hypothetical protein